MMDHFGQRDTAARSAFRSALRSRYRVTLTFLWSAFQVMIFFWLAPIFNGIIDPQSSSTLPKATELVLGLSDTLRSGIHTKSTGSVVLTVAAAVVIFVVVPAIAITIRRISLLADLFTALLVLLAFGEVLALLYPLYYMSWA